MFVKALKKGARALVVLAAAGVTAAALGATAVSPASAETTLRMATYPGPTHPFYRESWEPFAKEVEERTGGEVKIKLFPAEQLGKAADSVRMVQTGIADIVFLALPYHGQELPVSQSVNLPWGWDERTAAHTLWRAIHEPGEIHDEWKRAGLVPLMIYSNPSYEFAATNKPLPDFASLSGLKMRSPGDIYGPMLRSIDVTPIAVKTTEQYEALQRGLLDATIYTFSSWKSFSVDELLKHATINTKVNTVTGLAVAASERALERLTPEQRQILLETGRKYMEIGQAAVLEEDQRALESFVANGLQTYAWTDEEKAKLQKALAMVVDAWAEQAQKAGLNAPKILEEVKAFREAVEMEGTDEVPVYSN